MSGAPSWSSTRPSSCGDSAADDDRSMRSGRDGCSEGWERNRSASAWCIVGTAVNQVGDRSAHQRGTSGAWKPPVQMTDDPASSGANRPATSPCTWNSGMTSRPMSSGVNSSVVATARGRGRQVGPRQRNGLGPRGRAAGVQHQADVGVERRCIADAGSAATTRWSLRQVRADERVPAGCGVEETPARRRRPARPRPRPGVVVRPPARRAGRGRRSRRPARPAAAPG